MTNTHPLPALRRAACALVVAFAAPSFGAGADDSLYRALGERAGLVRLADDLLQRVLADPRLRPFFADIDADDFVGGLATQLCELSGGPCRYDGPDMKKAHSGLDIDRAAFNAVVESLQRSMDARGIAFATQNRLLARLAPLHREIVNVR